MGRLELPSQASEACALSVELHAQNNCGQPARTRTGNYALGEHRDVQFHHGMMEALSRIERESNG